MRFVFPVLVVAVLALMAPAGKIAADSGPCPNPGEVRVTSQADLDRMRAAGFPSDYIQLDTCWNPGSPYLGQEVADAKAFLISRYEIGPRSAPCISSKEQGIGGLKAEFAVRVARLIKDMEAQLGGRNIVRSAFRPQACGGGIGHSNGCAVDIEWAHAPMAPDKWRGSSDSPNVLETQWVLRNGGDPKYLIHLPFQYAPEWHHIEPKDRNGCLAGRALDPSVQGMTVSGPSGAGGSPLQNMMSGLQNMMTPPQPQQCAPGMILLNGTCVPQQTWRGTGR